MGQVCAKHQEFYETRCRWCERPLVGGLNAALPARSILGIDQPPRPVLGGWYSGYDLLPEPPPRIKASNEAIYYALSKPIVQANGLTLPVAPYRPDPTTRADVAAAWDAIMEPKDKHGGCE